MLEVANKVYKLILGDDLMFYHCRLSLNYWIMSTYYMALDDKDNAIAVLENMCEHAVEYDKAYSDKHGNNYTSVLANRLTYENTNCELREHSQCYYMHEHMKEERYDAVRTDNRFLDILNKLKEYVR